jgi:hypothetical protein
MCSLSLLPLPVVCVGDFVKFWDFFPTPPSLAPGIDIPEDYWFLALGPRSAQDMKEFVVVHPRASAKSLYAPEMLSEVAFAKASPLLPVQSMNV